MNSDAAGSGGVAAGRMAKVKSAEQHRLSVKWSLERLSEGGEMRMQENAAFLNSLPATQVCGARWSCIYGGRRVPYVLTIKPEHT